MESIEKKELKQLRDAFYNIQLKKISEETGKSLPTVRIALKYGIASPETLQALRGYKNRLQAA